MPLDPLPEMLPVDPRRARLVKVSPEFLLGLVREGTPPIQVCRNALPRDSVLVGSWYDHGERAFVLKVASEEFEDAEDVFLVPRHPDPVVRPFDFSPMKTEGATRP